jgi:hypothetical protein
MPLVNGRVVITVECRKCGTQIPIGSGDAGVYCSLCATPNSSRNFAEQIKEELQKIVAEERKRIRKLKQSHDEGYVFDDYSVGASVVITGCSICGGNFEGNAYVVDGDPICGKCYNGMPGCGGCGEKHLKKFLKDGLCNGCFVSFKKCPTCKKTYDKRIHREFEVEGKTLCPNCVGSYLGVHNIKYDNYSAKPRWTKFGEMDAPYYLGVELEIDNSKRREEFMARSHTDEIIYKSDGSLVSGVEVVSHPCTLDYHMNELPWRNILKMAHTCGYRGHTGSNNDRGGASPTCGLHIHVSREAFGRTSDERDKREAKLLLLVDKFWTQLVIFSRRDKYSLERWAKRYATFDVSKEELSALVKKAKDVNGSDRRMAVNMCNGGGASREQPTVEFRMFRSTLNYETLIATLQLVSHLIECSTMTTKKVQLLTWEEFRDSCDYSEFKGYIARLQSNKKNI